MLQLLKKFIRDEGLFTSKQKILLAVSGGLDSSVMCHLFHKAGYRFAIAHCNFGLRSKESDGDETFVKNMAMKYNSPFYVERFETLKFAKKNKMSVQMAARQLRYDWFEKIRSSEGFNYIAIAHHRDDETETFFINLIRGTGISGLHGILPKKNKIIRPLLFATRKDIETYAKKEKISFREDSSNLSQKYVRNRIRQTILPALKEMNPSVETTIKKDIERLREVELIFKQAIEEKRKKLVKKSRLAKGTETIPIAGLKKLEPIKTWLYELLNPYNFNIETVNDVISSLWKTSGKQFFSPTHRIIKDRESLIISSLPTMQNNSVSIGLKTKTISNPVRLKISKVTRTPGWKTPPDKTIACLDYDKLVFPLTLRKWKAGDSFYPLGMDKKKKLSDFLIDNKVPIHQKEQTYVLESGNKIIWIVGHRIDNRFRITEDTGEIYCILKQ